MQKRVIIGIVLTVIALDCYIKNYTVSHGKPVQEVEQTEHKLLQKLKKA